jgi:hypothetical protein
MNFKCKALTRYRHFHFPRRKCENIFWKSYSLQRYLRNFFAALRCFLLVHWLNSCFPAGLFFSRLFSQRASGVVVNYTRIYSSKKGHSIVSIQILFACSWKLMIAPAENTSRLSQRCLEHFKNRLGELYTVICQSSPISPIFFLSGKRPKYVHDNN